jgi:antitoxin component HigA of HigAB toxin-antitoxin module
MKKNFTKIIEAYLLTVEKPLDWLLNETGYSLTAYRNWKNGFKNPSLDAINSIALVLKNARANIWTPKQLITPEMKFQTSRVKAARTNIRYLCEKYQIEKSDIYNDERFGLSKSSVINVLTHDKQPNFENIKKFEKVFKTFDVANIKTHLDLIYFSLPWGESAESYIEIRNKIKLL